MQPTPVIKIVEGLRHSPGHVVRVGQASPNEHLNHMPARQFALAEFEHRADGQLHAGRRRVVDQRGRRWHPDRDIELPQRLQQRNARTRTSVHPTSPLSHDKGIVTPVASFVSGYAILAASGGPAVKPQAVVSARIRSNAKGTAQGLVDI